jgi:branched-chain amino acid transport system ATP-binding protein
MAARRRGGGGGGGGGGGRPLQQAQFLVRPPTPDPSPPCFAWGEGSTRGTISSASPHLALGQFGRGERMLELSNIDAGYGAFQALFGVSMTVKAGEAVAVIGANGAGKTTLLRVISGLLPATSGAMSMEGVSLRARAPHKIVSTGIAHVPEARRLFPRLSVESNLKMGAFIPAARAKFEERLAFVYELFPRLKERRAQLAGTLSGGEQQMCAIGRALMSGPKLVLLDEPSMGLAPVIVAQVFDLVRRIRAEGYTVLIVEQNVRQVLKFADRAYLLEVGRLKASGSADELLASDEIRKAYMGI